MTIIRLAIGATCAAVLAFAYRQATTGTRSDTSPLGGNVWLLRSSIVDPSCDNTEDGLNCDIYAPTSER